MKTVVTIFSFVSLMLAVGGCKIQHVDAPIVRVKEVKLQEQSDQGSVVLATVELENPNRVALPLIVNDYHMSVAGKTFAFKDKPQRVLPAKGTQTLQIPASFTTAGGDLSGASYQFDGSIEYNPPGQFRRFLTESGFPLPSVSYSQSGTLQQ